MEKIILSRQGYYRSQLFLTYTKGRYTERIGIDFDLHIAIGIDVDILLSACVHLSAA